MSSHEKEKHKLERLIRNSKKKSERIVKKSGELIQYGQYMSDLTDASKEIMTYLIPSNINWEPKIGSWEYANEQQDAILRSIEPIPLQAVMSSGSTVSYSMTDFAIPDNVVRFAPPEKQNEARIASMKLSNVLDRLAEKDKVLSLLQQYGLTRAAKKKKNPVELFETACAAYEKPVIDSNPVITSLIPMRECINGVIETLLRRRPKQESAKSGRNKILSIGRQLAAIGVPEREILSLAERWDSLSNDLSGAKQTEYTRDEWRDLLRRASLFLIELLQVLDHTKMK